MSNQLEQLLQRLTNNFEEVLERERENQSRIKHRVPQEDSKVPYSQRLKNLKEKMNFESAYIWIHISCYIWHSCLTTVEPTSQKFPSQHSTKNRLPRNFLIDKIADLTNINLIRLNEPDSKCTICEKSTGLKIRCPGNPKALLAQAFKNE